IYGAAKYPYMVTQGGVIPVANMTGITAGATPLSYCALYETPIDNGIIPVVCVDNVGVNHFLYIDPSTNELWVYNGTTVLDQAYGGRWHQVPWGTTIEYDLAAQQYNLVTGAFAVIPSGIFFIEKTSNWTLEFAPNMDFSNITTVVAAPTTIYGVIETNIIFSVIIAYSN
ncbi:MAG: hypothetical protein ACHP7O_03295, partial [Burkholderiales bacterium]